MAARSEARQAERDMAYLTGTECAGRLSGTEGASRAAMYLSAELHTAGIGPAGPAGYFHPVEVPASRLEGRARLSVAGRELSHRRDFAEAAALSSGGSWAGPMSVVRDGEALDPFDLAGRVVLIPERPSDFDLGATVSAAADLGVAVLIVESGEPRWFHKTVYPGGGRIPVLRIRSSLARELAARGGARVEGDLPLASHRRTCRNVLGILPGPPGAPALVLAAHYDHLGDDPGGERFPGGLDNASGVVTVLTVARELRRQGGGLPFNVLVAFLTGEESGAWGARNLVEHSPVPIWAAINVDVIGAEPELAAVRLGHALPGDPIAGLAAEVFAERGAQPRWIPGRDDSSAFIAAGIPTAGLGQQLTRPGGIALHAPDDTGDAVHWPALFEGASAVVEIVNRLAGSWSRPHPTQPERRTIDV